jgi:hypothetical protein
MSGRNLLIAIMYSLIIVHTNACISKKKAQGTNLGFEKQKRNDPFPNYWFEFGNLNHGQFILKRDSLVSYKSKYSFLIDGSNNSADSLSAFGCIATEIPVTGFSGKTLELRAKMKMQEVKGGAAGLLLRIDGRNSFSNIPGQEHLSKHHKTLAFDNMLQKNIKGTRDWFMYSTKLPFPKNAGEIYIGAILTGNGRLWVDEFELLLDGKPIPRLRQARRQNSDGKKTGATSGISKIEDLSPEKIENLAMVAKVWGFLKYYHPAVAEGKYNWDYELFKILAVACKSGSISACQDSLASWVKKFEYEAEKERSYLKPGRKVKFEPDFGWFQGGIDKKLSAELEAIRSSRRTGRNYYVRLDSISGAPIFQNEDTYSTVSYPDVGLRLLSLFRYWNIVEYFYPYKYLLDQNWDTVLADFIPEIIDARDELEYKLVLMSLFDQVRDGHARIWGSYPVLEAYFGRNTAPLNFSFVENEIILTGYFDKQIFEQSGLQTGDIIKRINGEDISKIIETKSRFVSGSNRQFKLYALTYQIFKSNDTVLTVEYQRNGHSNTATIRCVDQPTLFRMMESAEKDTSFKMLSPDIAYMDMGSFQSVNLVKIKENILSSKKLILDYRAYPNDMFLYYNLANLLFWKPMPFARFTGVDIKYPGRFEFRDSSMLIGRDNMNGYQGKLIILVNEKTQSAGEYNVMAFRAFPGAIVIGGTTGGCDGNIAEIYLPGVVRTRISSIGVYYPGGRETQRVGIVPDIKINPTIKGIREGRDELLEKAMEIEE